MASYAVASGELGAHGKTLVAATVDTITFAYYASEVDVVSDGAAQISFRGDGGTPISDDASSHWLPAKPSSKRIKCKRQSDGTTVVKVISAGTPKYGVTAA